MVLLQFLLPIPAARVGARSVSARKENQMMEKKKLAIMAMPLSKMGGEKIGMELWQWHCHNSIFFFFLFKEMISAHNFYNIFTTNFKWQVVIVGLKK